MSRLFQVQPHQIHAYPLGLPLDPAKIPDGPIPGCEAYARSWDGPPAILGPFVPVVEHDHEAAVIRAPDRTPFFWRGHNTPAFHQSGSYLRFIQAKPDWKPPTPEPAVRQGMLVYLDKDEEHVYRVEKISGGYAVLLRALHALSPIIGEISMGRLTPITAEELRGMALSLIERSKICLEGAGAVTF